MSIAWEDSNLFTNPTYQEVDSITDASIDASIVKVLEDTCKNYPNGIDWSTLLSKLKKSEVASLPSIVFREAVWRLINRGVVELTSDRLLKLAK